MTAVTWRAIQAEYPHRCADTDCAICWWVRCQWFYRRIVARRAS